MVILQSEHSREKRLQEPLSAPFYKLEETMTYRDFILGLYKLQLSVLGQAYTSPNNSTYVSGSVSHCFSVQAKVHLL